MRAVVVSRRACAEVGRRLGLDAVRQAGINAQEIENTVFEGAAYGCCKIQLDTQPPESVLEHIRARTDEVIFADLVELRA